MIRPKTSPFATFLSGLRQRCRTVLARGLGKLHPLSPLSSSGSRPDFWCWRWLACASTLGAVIGAHAATVVLDTGHTAARPGSIAPSGTPEYLFNLTFTAYLAQDLALLGIAVDRVAGDGEDIALSERAQGSKGKALFVSIHHDSIPQAWIDQGREEQYAGFAVFVSEKNPQYARSVACGKEIGAGLRDAGEHPSLYHATPIKGENRPLLDPNLGLHRFDELVVLRTAKSPAVLVEVGVIRNPNEEVRLAKPSVIRTLALAVARAIVRCV